MSPAHATAFDRALDAYLDALPKDKQKSKFVALCRGSAYVSPKAINDLIHQEQSKRALSGPVKRLFNRLTSALNDYSEVMGQLASVQPLPLAIIWGALKVVVESATRCNDMFDLMKDELRGLIDQIQRITDYEDLYPASESMQDLFFRSYTNIIRFWHRVHKECKRGGFDTIRHSLTSSNSKKLSAIVADLKHDVDCIAKKATIVQARLDSKEYAEAQKERIQAEEERVHQSSWRMKQSAHNYLELCSRIRDFLTPSQALNANINRHESNLQHHQGDTCRWLTEDPSYIAWSDPELKASEAVFCLSGPAGYGKSVLSSFSIRYLQQNRRAAVAYYFCQFSQPCDSVPELLRLFALQLFNVYFERLMPIDEALCHKVLCSTSTEQLQALVRDLALELAPAYIEVDGLDEVQPGASQATLAFVLRFICTELVGKANARLWITKRRQARPVECFDAVLDLCSPVMFEMADHTEGDVVRYLRVKFSALQRRFGTLSADDDVLFRFAEKDLTSRAKGHFLWARLMTQNFEGDDRVEDVKDLLDRVRGPPPEALDDLYQQIFRRIKPENRKIASKVMALIAFSRRQLRINEVREAAVLLMTRGKKNANDGGLGNMTVRTFLSKFTVLVDIDRGLLPEDEGVCRLVHSSVLEFVLNKPTALGDERAVHIVPYTMADACLLYLSRPVYAQLLRRLETSTHSGAPEWVDSTGRSMDEHYFVQYAAKYWSRHLEDVDSPQDALRKRVSSFIESSNFQTCMQVQSIWVQGKFDVYRVHGKLSLLRVFPDWFIRSRQPAPDHTRDIAKHWSDYRLLLHDWRFLLSCDGCHDSEPDCPLLVYRGELDRIWWGALGSGHLFSGFDGRYASFSLSDGREKTRYGQGDRFEAITVTDGCIVVLRLSSWNRESRTLEFACERWSAEDGIDAPTLETTQIIATDELSANWQLYAGKQLAEPSKTLVARPVAIVDDVQYLRIGAQVFSLHEEEQEYRPLPFSSSDKDQGPLRYFEEMGTRGSFVAFGTRAHTAAVQLQNPYLSEERFGRNLTRLERWGSRPVGDESDSDSEDDGNESDVDDGGSSSSEDGSESGDSDVSGYESWSEGSTDDDEVIDSDCLDDDSDYDDEKAYSNSETEVESDAESSSSGTDTDVDSADESDSDDRFVPPLFLPDPQDNSDDEGDSWGRAIGSSFDASGSHAERSMFMQDSAASGDGPRMQLVIFDTGGERPRKIFQYGQPMSLMLYASPPAIHPTAPLVVWPLGAGDVLFADFVQKSYFTRKLRPSALYTRNISVKVHFHPNGQFLHIVCLEAQIDEPRKKRKRRSKSQNPKKLKLFLFLSTFRLSSRKTTRSPPSLIHRVKAALGVHATLTVAHLPFTFAWTDDDLVVAKSAAELSVLRIPLFAPPPSSSGAPRPKVLVPKNKVFLPQTARARDVHFALGARGSETPARVVIGSEHAAHPTVARADNNGESEDEDEDAPLRKALLPPVGCVLREEDVGGWVREEDVPVPRGQGVGRLDRRKERFDPVEDCDVAPYLLFA